MYYGGWAFKPDNKERRAEIGRRHAEIIGLRDKIEMVKGPGHNHVTFTATVDESVLAGLTEMDILILADDGNLCFGGSCSRKGNVFAGSYSTD